MSRYFLENEEIKLEVESAGAEIKSLTRKNDNRQYMWYADKEYWGRTAPVLFPLVGSLKDKKYRWQGKEYEMGQHGFARDMEFTLAEQKKDSISFVLEADAVTLEKYPFSFSLELGYKLEGNKVQVSWKVCNKGQGEMYFSIGGHPAFLCPILEHTKQTDYYIWFDAGDSVKSAVLQDGLVGKEEKTYPLEEGYLRVTEDLFDGDALVMEQGQAGKVALCTPDKKPYLTVHFDAPVFGIWSPVKKNAPFICIEPWYGRADKVDFAGELQDREWGNTLKAQACFEAVYEIEVN